MMSDKELVRKQRRLLMGVALLMLMLVIGSSIYFMNFVTNPGKTTLVPQGSATATAPQPTSTPQLTPETLFFEDFTDNSKGWPIGDANGYTRSVDSGQLTLASTNHKLLIESLPTNTLFADFTLTMFFTLQQADKNDSVGLYLRGDSNLDHDYRIDIFGDSTYTISKEGLDENNNQTVAMLVGPSRTPALLPIGQANALTVIMKGSQMTLMINQTPVRTINDPDYVRGQIALFVQHSSASSGVKATFRSVEINTPPLNH